MKRVTHPTMAVKSFAGVAGLQIGLCALGLLPSAVMAAEPGQAGTVQQAQPRTITIGPPATQVQPDGQRLNQTGGPVTLTVPAKDGPLYLGDVVISISTEDRISFDSNRIIDLLSNIVAPSALESLRGSLAGKTVATPDDFTPAGLQITYDPQRLELAIGIPSELRAAQGLSISNLDRERFGNFVQPAGFSAYLNARGNLDYVHEGGDTGFGDPVVFLDFASRLNGLVFESQAIWTPGGLTSDFQRQGSRFIYDDIGSLVRWTVGDLQQVSRGYQGTQPALGVSVLRSYSALQPQVVARPRGQRSFTLDRPSTVEVYVNGQVVRRLQLQPGNYNLSDFPFTQGANDVRLAITDDAGRIEVLRFNIFFDQTQLAEGLSEFGFYAGVKSELAPDGPDYSGDWTVSGFYRYGVNDNLTLGANYQADAESALYGLEAVFGTSIGTFGVQYAASQNDFAPSGHAATLTFQRLIQLSSGRSDSFNLSYQYRSEFFGPAGAVPGANPFSSEFGAGYTHAFSDDVFAGVDLRYSSGRGVQPDFENYRGTVGWRISETASLTTDILYEDGLRGSSVAALIGLTVRLGTYSSVRGDYDSRDNRTRLGYQTINGQGVGSYNASADIETSDNGSGFNGNVNYIANRAELGASHFTSFADTFGSTQDQRTSVRVGTALAFADGAFSVGRPIFDSFAIVEGHRSLERTDILVEPTPQGYLANTGAFGTAIMPNLPAYSEQTITIDAPDAPVGVDLGAGSFRVFPPYRSGYRLTVGSDYSFSAIGTMLAADGTPLSLVSGTATELAAPGNPPITLFTNRAGRFGLSGLRPGRWRIDMLGEDPATYFIDVPADAEGVLRFENLKPSEGN